MSDQPTAPSLYIHDLAQAVEPPADGILSRTLHDDAHAKVVLFGFSTGQELSEHTAAVPAILHVVRGSVELKLGQDSHQTAANAWTYMPAHLPHSIRTLEPSIILLIMLKSAKNPQPLAH